MNRFVLLAGLAAGFAPAAWGQVFTFVPGPAQTAPPFAVPGPRPTSGAAAAVDNAALLALLAQAPPQRFDAPLAAYGLRIELPHPSGGLAACFVAESPVMDPALAARFPDISTYIVQTADGAAAGRIEVAPRGLTGMLRDVSGGAWMIDPAWSGDAGAVMTYWLRDLPGGEDWVCHTDPAIHGWHRPELGHPARDEGGFGPRALQDLRTVRVAMACTGEYGLHHSTIQGHAPNVNDPLAAIVTVIGRANVVYEADLAVHFNLVPDEDQVVFFDPVTDPFPDTCDGLGGADCSSPILAEVPGVIDSHITSPYDLTHCLTRVAGGVAYLQAVCFGGPGVSGIPRGGDVDPFSALVVIHEFGHQFGANHTFSGTRGRCGNNANLSTAWEAGSGSSPMAYAGGCPVGDAPPSDNIVQFADPFFHHGSLDEMRNFLPAAACLAPSPTANNIPVITSTTPDKTIPIGTPFILSAEATDADGDTLTYSWEQFDNGVRRPLSGEGSQDNGAGSLFRIFPPTTQSSRTFPKMADVLAGVATPGERLPEVAGVTRRFRVVVRDNHPGAGASPRSASVRLTIAGTGPFSVTAPTAGEQLSGGPYGVAWSTGGTQSAPISCPSVTIRLSADDGLTFPVVLGSFPNTGSATVQLPDINAAAARIRIDANANIFFAMSRPFTLARACPADFNGDGFLDFFDIDAFVAAFEAGDPSADFNGDGFLDFFDADAFVEAFEAGC